MKLSSTIKTRAHPFLVTSDVLRLHVVTKKNQFRCAIFRILIYSNPKILQISFLKPFLASVIKFFSSYKKFRRAVFKRRSCISKIFWFIFFRIYLKQLPLIPKSIFTGEYQQHQYTCFFILAFHIQLNMLYICANEMYIFWNAAKILNKLKAHTLEPQTSGLFGNLEAT